MLFEKNQFLFILIYMDNFTVEECDEKLEKIYNSRKHYSLTNPNILPCIPFSNPFTKLHKNSISNNNLMNTNNQNDLKVN